MKMLKYIWVTALPVIILSAGMVQSCSDEIPDDALGIKEGEMMGAYFRKNPEFSEFYAIITKARSLDEMKRMNYSDLFDSYGQYTCFAPTNDAVRAYLAKRNLSSVADLSAASCDTIVRYHVISDAVYYTNDIASMSDGKLDMMNMYKSYLTYKQTNVTQGGEVVASTLKINDIATINYLHCNDTVENGVVHEIDAMLEAPSDNGDGLVQSNGNFSIFYSALHATALTDTLLCDKDYDWDTKREEYEPQSIYSGAQWDWCLVPDEKVYGVTAFLVADDDLREKHGITSLAGLYSYAVSKYGQGNYPATYAENSAEQLKAKDNPLYQLMAYHILPFKADYTKLTTITTIETSYVNPTEWYRTVNNNGLMKIEHITLERDIQELGIGMETSVALKTKNLYINHFSDTVPSHASIPGVKIYRPDDANDLIANNEATNAFIYRIADLVDFSEPVRNSLVFNSRMRMDLYTLFPVLITNKIRSDKTNEGIAMSNSKDALCKNYWFPKGYIDGLTVNDDAIFLYQGPHNTYWSYEGDEFNITSNAANYDVTMEIPPLPTGTYQIRLGFADMPTRGICQFYFDDKPVGLPFDMRSNNFEDRTQWKNVWDDKGFYTPDKEEALAIKKTMHNNGWYHGPRSVFSINGEGHEDGDPTVGKSYFSRNARTVRYVLNNAEPVSIEYGTKHTIRIRSVLAEQGTVVMLDYLEFVPKSVWGVDDADGGEDDF